MNKNLSAIKPDKENLIKDSDIDSLTCYMKEIGKIQPLTRHEERELGYKIAKGDTGALQKLLQKNLKYVVSVASKYRGFGLSFQDLIEEGNIGLIQAAKRFDPLYKVKFITYAAWWVKQAIIQSLAQQARAVKLPISRLPKYTRVKKLLIF